MRVKRRLSACFVLLQALTVTAQQRSVTYSNYSHIPLLFGAVSTSCQSGCQSRTDGWGRQCGFAMGSQWAVCTQQQTSNVIDFARSIDNGGPIRLSPCDLVKFLEGRTLWLVGDSHTKSFYLALQCFLIDFWDHQECESNTDPQAVQDLANLPWQPGGSKCFHLLGDLGGRVCLVNAVLANQLVANQQVASGGVLPLLQGRFAQPHDIFYVSVGTWHEKNPGWWSMYQPSLDAIGRYYQANQATWPHLLFREAPAAHGTDLAKTYCKPAAGLTYDRFTGQLNIAPEARLNKWQLFGLGQTTNSVAASVLAKYRIPLVPSFNVTVPLYTVHAGEAYDNSGVDCLHYCHPGVPELWIYYMYHAFALSRTGIQPMRTLMMVGNGQTAAFRMQRFTCIPSYTYK